MTAQVTDFKSNTKLKGGHDGLIKAKGKKSKITITGENLADGKDVTIQEPPYPASPTRQWTGKTAGTTDGGKTCTAEVTQQKDQRSGDKDDQTTVSITVADSSPTKVTTYTGDAP